MKKQKQHFKWIIIILLIVLACLSITAFVLELAPNKTNESYLNETGGSCQTCPENTYNDGNSLTCQPCPSGQVSPSGSTGKSACVKPPPSYKNAGCGPKIPKGNSCPTGDSTGIGLCANTCGIPEGLDVCHGAEGPLKAQDACYVPWTGSGCQSGEMYYTGQYKSSGNSFHVVMSPDPNQKAETAGALGDGKCVN